MKKYVFEKSIRGMERYFKSINKIRTTRYAYLNTTCESYRESIKDEFNQANSAYKNYLNFIKMVTADERVFIDSLIHHHISPIHISEELLFQKWLRFVYYPMKFYPVEVDLIELGNRIKEARESICLSKDELAGILGISPRSIEAYENGNRAMPIDIYLKIISFVPVYNHLLE